MNPADICRECEGNGATKRIQELLDKVARLSKRNDELEELRRWRDAEKELPPRSKESGCGSMDVEIFLRGDVQLVFSGFYSYEEEKWYIYHFLNKTGCRVRSWRPLDLPEEVMK